MSPLPSGQMNALDNLISVGLGKLRKAARQGTVHTATVHVAGAEEETETRSPGEAEPRGKETDSPGSESQLATY